MPETTVNEIARALECFASLAIIEDRDLATPPGSPVDGAAYLVAASPTGAWTGHAGDIALYMGSAGWRFSEVAEGLAVWIKDENLFLIHNGTALAQPPATIAFNDLSDVNAPSPAIGDVPTWDGTEYVAAAPPGSGGGSGGTVPNGGATGQVLRKVSGVDQDTEWGGGETTGSWTPAVAFGGASVGVAYAAQVGRYVRTGNLVMATCRVQLTNNGSSTGAFAVTGLPFTSKNTANQYHAAAVFALANPAGKNLQFIVDPNTTTLRAVDITNGSIATEADVQDAFECVLTITYECEP